ncbi:MAG: hypothetical protein ACQEWM_05640 [Actinomycetota bacterium]
MGAASEVAHACSDLDGRIMRCVGAQRSSGDAAPLRHERAREIAQLMVVDCLFTGVAQAHYEHSIAALRRTRDAISQRSAH